MHVRLSAAATFLAILAVPAGAQEGIVGRDDSVYTTTVRVPSGGTFRLYNFNGPVETTVASGDQVQIRAEKRPRTSSGIRSVAFEMIRDGNTVTFCALRVGHSRCTERGMDHDDDDHDHDWDDDNRSSRVRFIVAVPRGVKLAVSTGNGELTIAGTGAGIRARSGNGDATITANGDEVDVSTGNGDVEVTGAGGPVEVRTGNGSLRVRTTTGPVNASTGNGPIDVVMDRLQRVEEMEFRTGNGRITVTLPANYQGRIDASTGNGAIESDFAITVDGRLSTRHLRGTIGQGGPRLRMSSGNGTITLRKGR